MAPATYPPAEVRDMQEHQRLSSRRFPTARRCSFLGSLVLLLACPSANGATNTNLPTCPPASGAQAISVPESNPESEVNLKSLGASTLYYLENDRFWGQLGNTEAMRALHLRSLRFPGGEIADSYDWKAGHARIPVRTGHRSVKSPTGGETSYHEFLDVSSSLGLKDVFFVTNVDGAFRSGGDVNAQIDQHATLAAEWVRAVRASGKHVQYWEIGNEPYLGMGYPLTVEEYATALKAYAKAMRAANPEISIGAAGPAWLHAPSFANEIGGSTLQALRKGTLSVQKLCAGLGVDPCIAQLGGDSRKSRERQKEWWARLIELAGDSFDFAVVHHYSRPDWTKAERLGEFPETRLLRELRSWLERTRGRPTPVALTEWNTSNERRHGRQTDFEHLVGTAVLLGNILASGIDFAHYWPLRSPDDSFHGLLDESGGATAAGRLFSMIGEFLPAQGGKSAELLLAHDVYVLRIVLPTGANVLMAVNRGTRARRLLTGTMVTGEALVSRLTEQAGGAVSERYSCVLSRDTIASTAEVGLAARSVTIVRAPAAH